MEKVAKEWREKRGRTLGITKLRKLKLLALSMFSHPVVLNLYLKSPGACRDVWLVWLCKLLHKGSLTK